MKHPQSLTRFAFLITLLTLVQLGCVHAQSIGLVWSTPTPVANGAVYDNIRPQIALAQGDNPTIIWASTTGGKKAWVTRWNGTGFDTPTQVNPTGQINAYTVEGPNLAARGDTIYAVYTTAPASSAKVMLRSSFDAGLTWNLPVWVDSLGADMPTFANVTIMNGGQPVVMYMRQTSTYANPRYVIRKSMDAGQTWLPEVAVSTVAPGGIVCDCCTGQTYWYDGKLISTFRNNNSNIRDIWAAISTDQGSSYGQAIDLDTTDWTLSACPSSGPVSVFRGDSIYTAFMSQGGNGQARIYLGSSSLATGQLGYNRLVNDSASGLITQNYPAIAGNGDTIVVAWYQNNGANPEIALRYSFTGPNGLWDRPVQYVSGWANGIQSFPDMKWSAGKLHMVWQDDAGGKVMYMTGTVGIPAGLSDPIGQWQIVPNPNAGRFRIAGLPTTGSTMRIYDLMGHTLFENAQTDGNVLELDLEALPSGTYFVRIEQAAAAPVTKWLSLQK